MKYNFWKIIFLLLYILSLKIYNILFFQFDDLNIIVKFIKFFLLLNVLNFYYIFLLILNKIEKMNDISSYDILDLNKLKCKNINNKII